ncbi:hypothetical protein ACH5RR_037303 [Cinchona calisaya]|uniref:Transposase MuDR plant domain-containing protein n=1 Tax=Cinchona calisaya TaxID=153742 RepID=A0ABD2Y9E9_9GENT
MPWEDPMEFNPEVEFRKPKFDLVVGQKFRNFRVFREVLYERNIREGYVVKPTKNESKMITAKCAKGCSWRIHASKIRGETTFQIKTLSRTHTCGREYNNEHVTSRYLAKKYLDKLRDEPDIGNISFVKDVKRDLMVEINPVQAFKSKRKAKEIPIIGLDRCFLKGPFGGQLLSTIGRDGNDNIYPIALAVVEAEMYDSWRWFLNELRTDTWIDDGVGWTFISDRQKELVRALEEEVPGTENRGRGRRSFNAASFATRDANSAGRASGSRKKTVRGRVVTATCARNKGNGTGMVKVAGWDGSFATPVGSAQQSIGKPPAGPTQTINKKVHSKK